ncbi:MAG: D-alanyl-D-alanine carboxypeptidase/D-alanyl-D-alanine-endopeptidase, partial [Gemmatimonadota bacterium]|nr:D-alanyl-D-alanine carboxypeptidase/D-alanyl-D-alanine-endopeptidase [Gemmatimonadota bacterium]
RWRPQAPQTRHLALLVGLLAAVPAGGANAQTLSGDVARLLDATPFNRNHWGLVVMDPGGRILASRHPDQLFMPASNTKLLVSAAAAVLLPRGFTVKTSVYGGGPVVQGTVTGDLVLYGRGDPTLSKRCYAGDTLQAGVCQRDAEEPLRQLAQRLRRSGVTRIAGDLVGDGSWFEPLMVHPTWEVYDLNWWYAAPVSGLGIHDNAVSVIHAGGVLGEPATIRIEPVVEGMTLENRTTTVADREPQTLDYTRNAGTLQIIAEGTVRQSTRPTTQYFALPDPNYYTATVFRRLLAEAGITVLGTTRSTTDSLATRSLRQGAALAEVASRPIEDWIYPVLNSSQNWFAEMLLKQLGKQFGGEGSWRAGHQVVRRFLIDSVRVDSTQFRAMDGSGLSGQNLVSPLVFAKLLQWMQAHPRYEAFAAGLPRSGERGSLRTRFVATPLEGHVRAKTGTIAGVNSLSGYIERPGQRPLIFSIVANHHALSSAAVVRQIDSVVVRVGRP